MSYAAATFLGGALTIYWLINTCTGPQQPYAVAAYNGNYVQLCPLQTTFLDDNTTVVWDGQMTVGDFTVTQYGYTYQPQNVTSGTSCNDLTNLTSNFFTLPCGPTGAPVMLPVYPIQYTFGSSTLTLFYGGAGCGPGDVGYYMLNNGPRVSLCAGNNYIAPDINVIWDGTADYRGLQTYYQGQLYQLAPGSAIQDSCQLIQNALGCNLVTPTGPTPPPPPPPFGPTGPTGQTGPQWILWVAIVVGLIMMLGVFGLAIYLYYK